MIEFKLSSKDHLSALLFGKEFKTKQSVLIGKYKNGNDKYQTQDIVVNISGFKLKPIEAWKTKKDGVFKVNEEVLTKLAELKLKGLNECEYPQKVQDLKELCRLYLKRRELEKQISTYYESTEQFIYDFDSCVHPEICLFGYETSSGYGGGVATGRPSARNPNTLNQPKSTTSLAKQHFTSRYKDGQIIEADHSQIEVVTQAQISGDTQYQQDVIDGIDFHCKYLALQEHLPYETVYKYCKVDCLPEWDHKRSQIKSGFTFAQQYGAGVKRIAEGTGLTEEEVTDLFEQHRLAYPQLDRFNKNLEEEVNRLGYYQTITGRKLYFKKYSTPEWKQKKFGIMEDYKRSEIVNYPIQSTATADITMLMFAKFWREKAIHNRDKYLLINTVYDSLVVDCREEHVEECKKDLKMLANVKEMMYNKFNYDWKLPVKVDIHSGDNWWET